jgi:tetratricopeptide (TPR) repeat protein
LKLYSKIFLTDVPEDNSETNENKQEAKDLLMSAHLNLALVYLKVTPVHHFEAKDHAIKALKFDENNVKGLFRKGQALLGLGEADAAMKDFQKVVDAEPQNKVRYSTHTRSDQQYNGCVISVSKADRTKNIVLGNS